MHSLTISSKHMKQRLSALQESQGSDADSEVDVQEDDRGQRPFYRRRWFRRILIPCIISVFLFLAGISLFIKKPRLVRPHALHFLDTKSSKDSPLAQDESPHVCARLYGGLRCGGGCCSLRGPCRCMASASWSCTCWWSALRATRRPGEPSIMSSASRQAVPDRICTR